MLLLPLCWLYLRPALPRRALLAPALALLLPLALYLALRGAVLGPTLLGASAARALDNPLVELSTLERLPHGLALLGRYAGQCLLPLELRADYSYATIDPAAAFGQPVTWGYLALCLALLALTGWGLLRRRAVGLWGGWFFAALATTSNIALPIGTIYAERLAYLPSLGVCALGGLALCRLSPRPRLWLGGLVLALCAGQVLAVSPAWQSNHALFSREVAGFGQNAKTRLNLGVSLLERGQPARAIHHLERAFAIYPRGVEAPYTLAVALIELRRFAEARTWLERALRRDPGHVHALSALGKLAFNAGERRRAEQLWQRALVRRPGHPDALLGLLALALGRGELQRAEQLWQQIPAAAQQRPEARRYGRILSQRLNKTGP